MGPDLALAAADGLVLRADGDSGFRLWWGDEDWLGAIGLGHQYTEFAFPTLSGPALETASTSR